MIKKLALAFCIATSMGIPSIAKASYIVSVTLEEFIKVINPGMIVVDGTYPGSSTHVYYARRDGIYFRVRSPKPLNLKNITVITGQLQEYISVHKQ